MGLTLHCRASADRHRLHSLSVSRIIFYPFDDKMTSVEVTADEVSRGREEKDHIPPLASFFYLYRTVCVPQVKSFDRESFQLSITSAHTRQGGQLRQKYEDDFCTESLPITYVRRRGAELNFTGPLFQAYLEPAAPSLNYVVRP